MMKSIAPEVYDAFRRAFLFPDPAGARWIHDGSVGLVTLAESEFHYQREVGYDFWTAALGVAGGPRLFFVRIDSWDPAKRAAAAPGEIDLCIPMAYEGAGERERLTWQIPFGGAWSDTREEALLVFDERWREWLGRVRVGLAFANPGGTSAAMFRFEERHRAKLDEYLRA